MSIRTAGVIGACAALLGCASQPSAPVGAEAGGGTLAAREGGAHVSMAHPLAIGETFTLESRALGEARRVNVFVPTVYGQKVDGPMPVLYMLDGGIDEDFLHIAGLVQILVSDAGMRPFMLVGIPNTARRRDMTGPTESAEDKKIAPVVGGSAAFRRFIKEELMPTVRARYRATDETAIVGESLAGLFVVESFFLEPEMFTTYIAIDPSLWWADAALVKGAAARLGVCAGALRGKTLFIASSDEPVIAGLSARLAGVFESQPAEGVVFQYVPMAAESHATVYHPAAMMAFRAVLAPPEAGATAPKTR